MMNTTTLQVRTTKQRKEQARRALEKMGLDLSSGVNMFLEQVIATESIPFASATRRGHRLRRWELYKREMEWVRKRGKRYNNIEELHADLLR